MRHRLLFRLGESRHAESIRRYDLMGLFGSVELESSPTDHGRRRRREWKTSVNPDIRGLAWTPARLPQLS
jgi:hypothetical protein